MARGSHGERDRASWRERREGWRERYRGRLRRRESRRHSQMDEKRDGEINMEREMMEKRGMEGERDDRFIGKKEILSKRWEKKRERKSKIEK